ncbi:hypothetical protein C2G38_1787585 [Gigaspora rosea]|uniref:Uncharacterized protein n=1 Tax=Gigaspora rosea TaxID=44941 RepID=A0A397UYX4_9GLOM|nr:hypothetical protein C2G38_1787585 [Gigaspora rosea]
MIKFSIFIIIALFVTLVNSENSNDTFNPLLYEDPEIIHPSKDAIQNIFDLMIVIFIFFLTEKFPIAYPTMFFIFLFELFVCALSFLFIIKAYLLTKDFFFMIYVIVYSVFSLYNIFCNIVFIRRVFLYYRIKRLENQEDFENQEHKRFISQELKQFVNNELEELKSQQKLLRDRLKSIHCSYFIYKAVYLVIFIMHFIFFIIASFKNYVNYIAYWVILIPSLIFIIYAIYDYLIPRVNIKSNGESKQRTVKCNIADIFNNNVLLRIIGICSHFLFCAVVGPNALWIKIYLTAVAVFVTLIEKIDEQIDQENDKFDKGEIKSDRESKSDNENENSGEEN